MPVCYCRYSPSRRLKHPYTIRLTTRTSTHDTTFCIERKIADYIRLCARARIEQQIARIIVATRSATRRDTRPLCGRSGVLETGFYVVLLLQRSLIDEPFAVTRRILLFEIRISSDPFAYDRKSETCISRSPPPFNMSRFH